MELYLFRHGIAEDAPAGSPDSARELTDEGREKVADVIRLVRRAGTEPAVIASSPYIRALQTAGIAAKDFAYDGEVVRLESLVPHGTPEKVWQDVRDYSHEPSILLVGHEPLLGSLVSFLLNCPALRTDVKKAAMIRIDIDAFKSHPHGVLRWMVAPKLARSVSDV
jgi:phosphohistidine phosphatase